MNDGGDLPNDYVIAQSNQHDMTRIIKKRGKTIRVGLLIEHALIHVIQEIRVGLGELNDFALNRIPVYQDKTAGITKIDISTAH
jgi:hypothetical protein